MLALFASNVKSGEATLSSLSILDLAIEQPLPKLQIIFLFGFGQTKQKCGRIRRKTVRERRGIHNQVDYCLTTAI